MDYRPHFDWSSINLFVAVADTGSLSGAARASHVSQPTVGRAVVALENDLGVPLFTRHARGFELTTQGQELLEHARVMQQAAASLSLAASGKKDDLNGVVRITASQIVSTYILPPLLVQLRRLEPRIQIELVATDQVENLLFREADIAVRMVRPTQQDLIARHVGDMYMGMYASFDYLADRSAPKTIEEFASHSVVGYDRSSLIIDGANTVGFNVDRDFFAYRCDDQIVHWQMVLAGLGIGFTAQPVAEEDERVKRILPKIEMPKLPLWLTSHSALKTNSRVRFVYDFLAQSLSDKFLHLKSSNARKPTD